MLLSIYVLLMTVEASALRCGNKLVNRGDRKIEVILKCGEPLLIERWIEEVFLYERDFADLEREYYKEKYRQFRYPRRIITATVEEWTYNFGSNRFLYFLQFRDNKLHRILEGSRGFSGDILRKASRARCIKGLSLGDKKIEVLMKCGEPVLKERTEDEFSNVISEEWTYNFGARRFLYFVKFRRGEVVNIESGDYGY